ncbi:hypothetical protein BH10PSE6_BH10PSE6_26180 [soil metagenome]
MDDPLSLPTLMPYWAFRSRPDDIEKTIVVTGTPRGGTTFAASVVASLGLPFRGDREQGVNGKPAFNTARYEHSGFIKAWKKDRDLYAAIAREMDAQLSAWAIKHPRAVDDLEAACHSFRNPHFIFAMKEPMSVAMRLCQYEMSDLTNEALGRAMKKTLRHQLTALDFCLSSGVPCLMVSYDMAMRNVRPAIDGIAGFLGIERYDAAAIEAVLRTDWDTYTKLDTFKLGKRSDDPERRRISRGAIRGLGRR